MKHAAIESPYAGDVEANVEYARRCVRHSLYREEAPFASHLLYPQVLDDNNPEQRNEGMRAGYEINKKAEVAAFYVDRGFSVGMAYAAIWFSENGIPCEFRSIRYSHDSKPFTFIMHYNVEHARRVLELAANLWLDELDKGE